MGGIPEIAGSVFAIVALLGLVWYGTRKAAEEDEQEDAEP
jgi:hypothetical protein